MLPAEIRVYIYELAFSGEHHKFHNLRLPATSQVSSQIRTESLPVFFTQASFELYVGANMTEIHPNFLPPSAKDNRLDSDYAGLLLVDQKLADLLEVAESQELISLRRVVFKVTCSGNIGFAVRRDYSGLEDFIRALDTTKARSPWESFPVHELVLNCQGPTLEPAYTSPGGPLANTESMGEISQSVIKAADGMCRRRDFRGFTLRDLRSITSKFREEVNIADQ